MRSERKSFRRAFARADSHGFGRAAHASSLGGPKCRRRLGSRNESRLLAGAASYWLTRIRLAAPGRGHQSSSRTSAPPWMASASTSFTSAARVDNPLPLILTHGYPDSFMRFSEDHSDADRSAGARRRCRDAFDVVVPSLPGYGFSDKPRTAGFTFRIGDLWHALMTESVGVRTLRGARRRLGQHRHRATRPQPCPLAGRHSPDGRALLARVPEARRPSRGRKAVLRPEPKHWLRRKAPTR